MLEFCLAVLLSTVTFFVVCAKDAGERVYHLSLASAIFFIGAICLFAASIAASAVEKPRVRKALRLAIPILFLESFALLDFAARLYSIKFSY